MQHSSPESSAPSTIPKAIWAIGSAVFFINLSSVMIRSLATVYMKAVLGTATTWIGMIEGIVEGLSFLMKMISGVFSDYLRRRKLLILLGYGLIFISRPVLGVFSSIQAVVAARVMDRLGNGVQASPRDALVGDLSPEDIRGACYGLRMSLSTAGSFGGALLALVLMHWRDDDYQLVFWLASIPAFIAVVIMACAVREPEHHLNPEDRQARHPIHIADIKRLGRPYWLLMIVVSVFMVAQLGEAIMVLHAYSNFGLLGEKIPIILLIYNFTYSVGSYPAGRLSDQLGRYNLLALGFVFLIAGDLILARAMNLEMMLLGVAVCGLQMAATQGVFMSLITDSIPKDLRGTGFGMYYLICAASVFISNTGAGWLAEHYGESVSFYASAGVATIALILLWVIKPRRLSKIVSS